MVVGSRESYDVRVMRSLVFGWYGRANFTRYLAGRIMCTVTRFWQDRGV